MKTLYESLLKNSNDKVKDAKSTLMITKELEDMTKLKWKKVDKVGSVTKYEIRWKCPYVLAQAFSDYKNGPVDEIVFHLNTTNGGKGGIIFSDGPTINCFFFIELLNNGKGVEQASFYEYASQGVKGVQQWALKFIVHFTQSVDSVSKGCHAMFPVREKYFMAQIIKKITGKNHWQL
jgi:hypothetical protein